MPPHVVPDPFLCDPACSMVDTEDDINHESWFSHVLPQIRGRSWYGHPVQEFIQGPGDTLYIPANRAHAILNIEENISVTENYFLEDSLEDWVHGMMTGDTLIEDDSDGGEEERFWKTMYFKLLEKEERNIVREMIRQVEFMASESQEICGDGGEDSVEEKDDDESGNDMEFQRIADNMFDFILSAIHTVNT